jgi:hypothetical protein
VPLTRTTNTGQHRGWRGGGDPHGVGRIGELMKTEISALFGDYVVEDGAWIPAWRKV